MSACQIVCLTLCALAASSLQLDQVRYDNHHLIEFTPANGVQRQFFARLQHLSADHIFLSISPRPGVPWLVVVAPNKLSNFRRQLRDVFLHRTVHTNLQTIIEAERQQTLAATAFNWTAYHTLVDIYAWMDTIQANYPQQVQRIDVGDTFEQRKIRGVRVAYGDHPKPVVFIECGMHAREWISTAVCTYFINELVTSQNAAIRQVAESHEWHIVPTVNPDGYAYTQTERLWRKTRSKLAKCSWRRCCFGADGNRNWNYEWNTVGGSSDKCSEIYSGSEPFSEVETKTYERYLRTLKIDTFLSFHAYSQLLMFPFSNANVKVSNYDDLLTIGQAAAKALKRLYGTEYVVGSSNEVIYATSGSSDDYAYAKLGVPVVFTYELRPKDGKGSKGFELPADQIVKVGEETMESVVALLNTARALGYNKVPGV